MPNFQVEVPHSMERDLAAQKLREFSDQAREQMPAEITELQENWDDDGNLDFSFKAMGFKVSGQMISSSETVVICGNLPFAALPFRGLIEQKLIERIQLALDSSK